MSGDKVKRYDKFIWNKFIITSSCGKGTNSHPRHIAMSRLSDPTQSRFPVIDCLDCLFIARRVSRINMIIRILLHSHKHKDEYRDY